MSNNSLRFSVAGRIISELSEKIPDTIVALNELIKNSYDAFAKEVTISLNSEKKELSICDDGTGMTLEQIKRLFHIAKSDKHYGTIICGKIGDKEGKRICQGSKGLGFLAAFKFGAKVKWKTSSLIENRVHEFTLNRDEINQLEDLSTYNVDVSISDFENQGTIIEISLDDYSLATLVNCFSNETDYKKIVESIIDDNFKITIIFDGKVLISNALQTFREQAKEIQICEVKYNSANHKLVFSSDGVILAEEDYIVKSEEYTVSLDIVFYSFKGIKKKTAGISNLFYRPKTEDLTPLLYINNVLFNNFHLYDPEINRKRSNSLSFPQQVGYINVCSDNHLLEFNSDRTNLVKNALTDNIADTLCDLNLLIQKVIAEKISNRSKLICKSKKGEGSPTKSKVPSPLCDSEGASPLETPSNATVIPTNPLVARIILVRETDTIKTFSGQISLLDYVDRVIDSHGNEIDRNMLTVYCDDEILSSKILESQTVPCIKTIRYEYVDELTKLTCKTLTLTFENETTKLAPVSVQLIGLYKEFEEFRDLCPDLLLLIDELNGLNPNTQKLRYPHVTACALRTVLELAVDMLVPTGDLKERVKKILSVEFKDKTISQKLKNGSIQYKNLINIVGSLNDSTLESVMSTLHISTHKSTRDVSEVSLIHAAKSVSLLLYIISVYLKCNIKP